MAEKLYFIKADPVAAKINLYNKICREEQQLLPFLREDKKTSLELIRKKVQENSESLSKEELTDVLRWFDAQYHSNDDEFKTQLFVHGIDIFHEIADVQEVEIFNKMMSDYEKQSQTILEYPCYSEKFNHFVIYALFVTGFTRKRENQETALCDFLKSHHQNLYSLAEMHSPQEGMDRASESMYRHFENLYDDTRFYKGSVIRI